MGKLIVDGNQVYEIDEECMERKKKQQGKSQKDKTETQHDKDSWKKQWSKIGMSYRTKKLPLARQFFCNTLATEAAADATVTTTAA